MIKTSDFDYKLLKGSHEFPGPAGGACLNEVAIVAAGLDYRKVDRADDCPPCFSRPIAAYVIALNDTMPDRVRQGLKRFVMRLAGSADVESIEKARTDYIVLETLRHVFTLALPHLGERDLINEFKSVSDLHEAYGLIRGLGQRLTLCGKCDARWLAVECDARWSVIDASAGKQSSALREAVAVAVSTNFLIGKGKVWPITLAILDGALLIGTQAPPIPDTEALVRLGRVFAPTRKAVEA